ncbi:MAG: preprotein translocase subunit Sec61beta [Candidatus Altiarchaeota archaeon]|nr:preprotein translocase subunit Sec61beta [Candidatus Altiarchaeota archaeon]
MAKQKATLPASYGGLMRYDESLGDIKLSPGHVVVLVLAISALMILLKVLG